MRIPGDDSFGFMAGAAAIALLCLAIAARAFYRGRRVLAAPSCRKCGYDVSRRPTESTRCSECGADLTAPKAIATHKYSARWWAIAPLILAIAVSVVFANSARRFQWRSWYVAKAPTFLVIHHAVASPGMEADDMRLEWDRRGEQRTRLIEHLLDIQSPKHPFPSSSAATLLEQALLSGGLSESQKQSYFNNLLGDVVLRIPQSTIADQPIPFDVTIPNGDGSGVVEYEFSQKVEIDGDATLNTRPPLRNKSIPNGFSGKASEAAWRDKIPYRGEHTMTLRVGVRVVRRQDGSSISPWIERTVTVPFELDFPRATTTPALRVRS